jgi:aminoglycoside phosphotransferase
MAALSVATADAPALLGDLVEVINDENSRIAVLGASRDPNAKLTVLVLPDGSSAPSLAIKVPTTARAAAAVARERQVLDALHRLRSAVIEETAPRVLDVISAGGHEAMVQSAVAGTPMTTLYLRWRHTRSPRKVARDLAAITAWLCRLHDETASETAPVEMEAGIRDHLTQRYGAADPALGPALDLLGAACARLRGHRAPRTVVHGDLWCGNVLVRGASVSGVIDWEEADLSGEPLRDIVRFALSYVLYLDRHTRAGRPVPGHPGLRAGVPCGGIDYLLFGGGWICDLLRAFMRLGMRRVGIPGVLWPEAVVAGVAEVAARSDDEGFGRAHLDVLARVARRWGAGAT